jgi:hypothetical protein
MEMNDRLCQLRDLACTGALLLGGCGGEPPTAGEMNTEHESSGSANSEEPGEEGPAIICEPGQARCADEHTLELCAPTGLEWEPSPCGAYQACEECPNNATGECAAACVGPCERVGDSPSSAGCSFYTTGLRGLFGDEPVNALVVTNPDPTRVATLELRFVPEGTNKEELVEGPVSLPSGESHTFLLPPDVTQFDWLAYSMFRSGFVHHLTSDLPVRAYLHAPVEGVVHSGSTMLLPEHALAGNYVVYGYPPYVAPNYFTVIAVEDQTTLRWWPRAATAGDALPLPFVEAGGMGEQLLNRFDNVRIDSSAKLDPPKCQHDLSGTVLSADKPVWVVSAVVTANVPFCSKTQPIDGCATVVDEGCGGVTSDFVLEQLLPLDYWGTRYVGPHAPLRGGEEHHWRIFAGSDDVSVAVEPPQPGTPIHLAQRGDWAELVVPSETSLRFEGDGPFMPVQYVTSNFLADVAVGGAAMVQMVPTAQFEERYVFATRSDFDRHYVQIIRATEGAEVLLDDVSVDSSAWVPFGEWLIATVEIDEGPHSLESADAFGALPYGYAIDVPGFGAAGYGYPVGLSTKPLVVP